MPPKFGTSGLRGLVTDLTADLVADYTRAFCAACETGGTVYVGRDLRPSSPDIAEYVAQTASSEGIDVIDCGALPTPALALLSMNAGAGAVMVTGSHIPADRNGLKFYVPGGEISKADEQAITENLGRSSTDKSGSISTDTAASANFETRYSDAFGADALNGLRIGIYQHSSVGRDIMSSVVSRLGGTPVKLGRSDTFIPVDTEALDPETQDMLAGWCREHNLDAVMSTDGDADRPMLADSTGQIIPGDVLGVLTAQFLGATHICTPVSSNSMVQHISTFQAVTLTRIGSPFVIAAMENTLRDAPNAAVVGYEANGGFLLGFHAKTKVGTLSPLMTRDSILPMIAPLVSAANDNKAIAELVADLPPVYTAADRIQGIPTETSKAFIEDITSSPDLRRRFFEEQSDETALDLTDGVRVTFASGDIVHLRPSGNAPELRCYAESRDKAHAAELVSTYLAKLRATLT